MLTRQFELTSNFFSQLEVSDSDAPSCFLQASYRIRNEQNCLYHDTDPFEKTWSPVAVMFERTIAHFKKRWVSIF